MTIDSTSFQELINDPVTHFGVVGRDCYEGWLNEIGFDRDKGGKQVETLFDLINSLLLVCDNL